MTHWVRLVLVGYNITSPPWAAVLEQVWVRKATFKYEKYLCYKTVSWNIKHSICGNYVHVAYNILSSKDDPCTDIFDHMVILQQGK